MIPVLLPGAGGPRKGDVVHLGFLINPVWVEFLKTLYDERAFQSLVWGDNRYQAVADGHDAIRGGLTRIDGLEAFRPDDEKFSSVATT